jgi:hypothetical protein
MTKHQRPRFVRILLALAATSLPVNAWADDGDGNGDRARVARASAYLDARQAEWGGFARAFRGEGADRTTCVSCHTGISYALARPALERFGTGPGTGQARMSAAVELRVAHWTELDSPRFELMYDLDDRKKVESQGTEAVLNALALARADAVAGRAEPGPATRGALATLWKTQTTEGNHSGSWEWLNFGLEPWETPRARAFGAALGAIAAGSAPGYLENAADEAVAAARGVRLLRDYLQRRFPDENLHNRLWILEASTRPAFADVLSADQKRAAVEQILALQRDDGGWALATLGTYKRLDGSALPGESDGYATGVALHVLLRQDRTAAAPSVARGLAWLRSHQRADGSWPGWSLNKERDPATMAGKLMTDAATALGALAVVEAGAGN